MLYQPKDAYQDRISTELGRFRTWAGPNAKLWLGETGIPNNKGAEQTQWNDLHDILLARATHDRLNFTVWSSGNWWGAYELLYYTPSGISYGATATTPKLEQYLNRQGLLSGVNFAGGEFAHEPNQLHNNSNSTQLDSTIMSMPTLAQLQYLKSRGVQIIRLPIRWERLQTQFNQPLRSVWVNAINDVLNKCQQVGIKVMIDVHNYAKYNVFNGVTGVATPIRTGVVTQAVYNDFLLRLVQAFGSHQAFHSLDTMNEPSGVSASLWEQISQSALTHLRNNGFNGLLHIELGNWAGIQELPSKHSNGPWITDPANNFFYHGHYYPEADHTGSNFGTYSSEVTKATNEGFRANSTSGSFDLSTGGTTTPVNPTPPANTLVSSNNVEAWAMKIAKDWFTWLDGKKGFVGEFGIPWAGANTQQPNDIPQADRNNWINLWNKWFALLNDKGIHATAWAGGNHWGSYPYTYYDDSGVGYIPRWNVPPLINTNNNNKPNYDTATYRRGINLAGAEFGFDPGGTGNHSNQNLTADWVDSYGTRYPTLSDYQFFASQNLKLIRLPFRAEKMFPSISSANMNTTELNALKTSLDHANTAGCKVIVDMHNYASYTTGATKPYTNNKLGQGWNVAIWSAQWVALMNEIKNKPALLAIDIMNEPSQNYTAGSPTLVQKGASWETNSTTCVTALRNAGWNGIICVPTAEWSGVHQAPEAHPNGPWINENNIWWEVHQYFDKDQDGITNLDETWSVINSAYSSTPQQSYLTSGTGTVTTAPQPPTNLSATVVSESEIRLNWSDNATNETGYKVERKTDTTNYATIADLPANSNIFLDSGLTADTKYYYRVSANNEVGSSNTSNETFAYTKAVVAPTNDRVNLIKNPSFEVNVTDNTLLQDFLTNVNPSISRDTTDKPSGLASVKVTIPSSTEINDWKTKLIINTDKINFIAGRKYSLQFMVKTSDAKQINVFFEETGGIGVYPFPYVNTQTSWAKVQLSFVSQVTKAMSLVFALNNGGLRTINIDQIILEENVVGFDDYFDGSLGGDYAWSGIEHNSISTYTVSSTPPPVRPTPDKNKIKKGSRIGLPPMLFN